MRIFEFFKFFNFWQSWQLFKLEIQFLARFPARGRSQIDLAWNFKLIQFFCSYGLCAPTQDPSFIAQKIRIWTRDQSRTILQDT